jgi:hypothetical protein
MNVGTDSREARETLAAERASAQERLTGLERDFAGIVESSASANADDEHDPEGAPQRNSCDEQVPARG